MPIFLVFKRSSRFKAENKLIVTYRNLVQFDRELAQKMVQ